MASSPPTTRDATPRRALVGALLAAACIVGAASCGDFQFAEYTKATTTTIAVEGAEDAEISALETTSTTLRPARYTVQSGESLGAIATRFGVTIDAVMLANNIIDANDVRAGTIIVIPDPDTPVAPPWQQGESLAVNR